MQHLVSIIIPAYNPGPFLAEALRSVVAQAYQAWECVVVDDGSSEDLSWAVGADPRIRLIRRTNRGPSAARNTGVAQSVGGYIAFLDADDVWRPDKLARQVALMEANPRSVLCHSGAELIDSSGRVVSTWPWARRIASYADLFQGNGVVASSSLVRRASLIEAGGWNTFLRAVEDFDLWLRLSLLGDFAYDEDPLVQYRHHASNQSANGMVMATSGDFVLRLHEQLARQSGDKALEGVIRAARRAGRQSWGALAYDQARKELGQRHYAFFGRHWIEALRLCPRYTLGATARYLFRPATTYPTTVS